MTEPMAIESLQIRAVTQVGPVDQRADADHHAEETDSVSIVKGWLRVLLWTESRRHSMDHVCP